VPAIAPRGSYRAPPISQQDRFLWSLYVTTRFGVTPGRSGSNEHQQFMHPPIPGERYALCKPQLNGQVPSNNVELCT